MVAPEQIGLAEQVLGLPVAIAVTPSRERTSSWTSRLARMKPLVGDTATDATIEPFPAVKEYQSELSGRWITPRITVVLFVSVVASVARSTAVAAELPPSLGMAGKNRLIATRSSCF